MRNIDGQNLVSSLKEVVDSDNRLLSEKLTEAKHDLREAQSSHFVLEEQSIVLGLAMERSGVAIEKTPLQEKESQDRDVELAFER
ncbi:MAG: hypothetical protein CFH43_00182 [Proteobacteria bacterium]|nr:MAG: hypothetical protein CFH43_00182 [Pseudomonadota bacterium]|tara:strand:- start:2423 stop:2677 length:255 start_codon:yes stop_codon:yes gene_type:complete